MTTMTTTTMMAINSSSAMRTKQRKRFLYTLLPQGRNIIFSIVFLHYEAHNLQLNGYEIDMNWFPHDL